MAEKSITLKLEEIQEMKKYYELDDNKDLNEEDGFEYYIKYNL